MPKSESQKMFSSSDVLELETNVTFCWPNKTGQYVDFFYIWPKIIGCRTSQIRFSVNYESLKGRGKL